MDKSSAKMSDETAKLVGDLVSEESEEELWNVNRENVKVFILS